MSEIPWYLEVVNHELTKSENGRLTGNLEFKINFKEGKIYNMLCTFNKSVMKPRESRDESI